MKTEGSYKSICLGKLKENIRTFFYTILEIDVSRV